MAVPPDLPLTLAVFLLPSLLIEPPGLSLLLLPVPTYARPPGPAAAFSRFTTALAPLPHAYASPTHSPTSLTSIPASLPASSSFQPSFQVPSVVLRPLRPSTSHLLTLTSTTSTSGAVPATTPWTSLSFSLLAAGSARPLLSFLSSRLVSHRTALPVTVGGSTLRRRPRPLELLPRSQQHSICHLSPRDRFYAGFLDFIHRQYATFPSHGSRMPRGAPCGG